MEEQVELILNHKGENFTVVVDIGTANILLNDPVLADQYIQLVLEKKICTPLTAQDTTVAIPSTSKDDQTIAAPKDGIDDGIVSNVVDSDLEEERKRNDGKENLNLLEKSSEKSNRKVWSQKRPTDRDMQATEAFLELRKQYTEQFNDRKTAKSQLWLKIAAKMKEMGFYVGDGKDAIEKLRLKFSNLQKQYLLHIKHMTSTGEGQKDPPPFFDLLHDILGKKHKCNPSQVEDTEQSENVDRNDLGNDSIGEESSDTSSYSSASGIKKRFSSQYQGQTQRTKSINYQFLEMAKRESEERSSHFATLENLLATQNEQRERFLGQIDQFIKIESKKRKHEHSDDSD